ncbi:DUF4270 family protein [Chitinophaga sp. Mgbs1]|uniref:DUF4270 family protein n=1 Tax=Chitinophaga solisilvae TaxID=1233460 RepID=A0A433WA31_9BACT|nr:DUF4270 family protein [Chitinophaga solisilvae]
MKINFRNLSFAAAFFTLLYGASGCNESTILGSGLIPPGDFVNAKDTTLSGLIANNIYEYDTTAYNGPRSSLQKLLGSITTDPLFGKSHAFLYTQVGLPSSEFTFAGSGQVLDSVVLSLRYYAFQGDSLGPQTFRVYRMTQTDFRADSNYSYAKALAYNQGELLGTTTITPRGARDSVSVYGKKEPAQIRIKLSNAFGNELLQQKSNAAFKNDSSFRAYLRGFAIVPDTSLGSNRSMFYVNLNDADTRLTVYYKNSADDSLISKFTYNANTSASSVFLSHNYNGSEAARYLNTKNANGDSILFLQSSPGIYSKLSIPGLENFPNVAINKAEVVVTQITTGPADMNDLFIAPSQLYLEQFTDDKQNKTKTLPDDIRTAPNNPIGGTRQVVTNFGGVQIVQYTFTVNRYMQMLVKKQETNNGFKLEAGPYVANLDITRLKAGGTKLSTYNLKMRIIYTKP